MGRRHGGTHRVEINLCSLKLHARKFIGIFFFYSCLLILRLRPLGAAKNMDKLSKHMANGRPAGCGPRCSASGIDQLKYRTRE